jgi:hypothetical protein
MSDKEELVYHEVTNPVYKALVEHVKVETVLAKLDGDIFGYSIGYLSLKQAGVEIDLDIDILKSKFEEVRRILDEGDLRPIFNTELLLGLFLAYKALAMQGKVTKTYQHVIKEILELVASRGWLDSTDLASYACFSVGNDRALKNQIEVAAIWLGEQIPRQWQKKAYVNYVSALFGASHSEAPLNWLTMFDERQVEELIQKNLLTPRDIARLGLALMQLSKRIDVKEKLVGDVILQAESEVAKELCRTPAILLDHNIREALSLLESGIPILKANEIIRHVGGELSESIQLVEDGKIVLRKPPSSISLPTLDPERHSTLLMLLSQSGRDKEFLLDRHNLQKAKEGVNLLRKGHTTVSKRVLSFIKGISTTVVFLLALTLSSVLGGTSITHLLRLGELLAQGDVNVLSLPLSLIVGFYITVVWFRFLDTAFTYGNVAKARWMHLFPLIGRAYRAIKGESHE